MENIKEVTTNFEIPSYIGYTKEYLIDVPETEVNKGHERLLVTLHTMELKDNNEVNAQIIAEAHCYHISIDEYYNEELGNLVIDNPYEDIAVNLYYTIDYRKQKKVSFKDFLTSLIEDGYDLSDNDRYNLLEETRFLLKELPEKYLTSILEPNQVIEHIKANIYDDVASGELSYYEAHKIYYSLVVNFDYRGSLNFPLNNTANVDDYWYIVRGMLGKGNFIRIGGLPSKPLLVDCGNAKVLLEERIDPTFRVGIFDEQNKQLFYSRFMNERMRVSGKFSLTCGDRVLGNFEGNCIIYEYEGLYAIVETKTQSVE